MVHLLTLVTDIISKLICWEFSPVLFRSKFSKFINGEFSSGGSLQDLSTEFRSECHRIGEWQVVFDNGPEKL